jgi:exopolyphosphatase / guanosine-5'-triphosphate,3'-diphosphate pyrophosphatase
MPWPAKICVRMSAVPETTNRELRSSDLVAVREQIGREPTTPFTIVARCSVHPLVIRNAPRDASGAPFPTTYWLTCPDAVKAVARLEADGWIGRLNESERSDPVFADSLNAAHRSYAEDRARDLPEAIEEGGVGGTRVGVKCLHAHYAFHLAGGVDPVGRWVAEQVEPIHAEERPGRAAVIDQGTNSIRMLVVEPSPDGRGDPTELARDMVITRLGQGVDRTGRIDPEALRRTIDVLARYSRRARALHAERIRVAATSAVRDAENRHEFAEAVLELAGSELEVISGEREAGLSFLGGTHGLDPLLAPPPFLVLDIGGGSTELVVGAEPGRAEHAISTRMGSVRLTERFVRHDPPNPEEMAQLTHAVEDVLDDAEAGVPIRDARTLVGVAGTATTLQAIALGLDRYDPEAIHRTWLHVGAAERILADLVRMTTQERAVLPVMAPGRGDVIVAGAVILTSVMRRFGFDRVLVSETDILDGLSYELLDIR